GDTEPDSPSRQTNRRPGPGGRNATPSVKPRSAVGSVGPHSRVVMPVGGDRPTLLRGLPPLSLYVHVPWCVRKCPYCDFNSHELGGDLPEQAYLAALQADLEQALPLVWGRQVISIFI